jgi:hypothetical protein
MNKTLKSLLITGAAILTADIIVEILRHLVTKHIKNKSKNDDVEYVGVPLNTNMENIDIE